MLQILQESAIPVTDKIFPWFVETALLRVEMEGLRASLGEAEGVARSMPKAMATEMALVMAEPIRSIKSTQGTVVDLSVQLQKSAVVQSAIARSGWRGVAAAVETIFHQQSLAIVVGAIALCSGFLGGWLVWQVGARNREVLEYNDGVIEQCYQRFLPNKGTKKWFSCPGFQLPRVR